MAFVRRVRTGSGATAVQVVQKRRGRLEVLKHVGSARSQGELGVLLERAQGILREYQPVLDLGIADPAPAAELLGEPKAQGELFDAPGQGPQDAGVGGAQTVGTVSDVLWTTLRSAYGRLGFDVVDDEVFAQLVLARLIEPASKLATIDVLRELGVDAPHRNTINACLKRINAESYRDQVAAKCFEHATSSGDISLILYDVTTLYFEAENEDGLRKIGYSKERRVDPQIVVGLLVDRGGFPLEIGCFEGNHAETHTLLPIIEQFQGRHNIEDMVIVADAGMLSQANLQALDEANLRFIVGSRTTKAPGDLARHFHWHGDAFEDGQVIDTITPRSGGPRNHDTAKKAEPVWDPAKHPKAWRAIWQYSRKRAARDTKTITTQENRALAIINGEVRPKNARFVTTTKAGRELDIAALERARRLVGLKGYQTNIPATLMPAAEVISSYHDLWQVEASFRMSKSDLRARPIFHRTRESIEAHLTIVFTALALARYMQAATGLSLKKIITTLRPIRAALIRAGGQTHKLPAHIPPETAEIINQITEKPGH